ncbi:phosphate transporter PHO1-3 [Cocos nucifera]|nr:phosphate transporter PHO1-3 [Cocos nucifera]
MVKFSKQFEGQLVPEWKEAFVDYWQLKKDLKRMHVLGANQALKVICSLLMIEEESIKGTIDQDPPQEISTGELEKCEVQFPVSPQRPDEPGKLEKARREEEKLRSFSGRVIDCQGKSLKIKIPLTTPSRTISALADLLSQSKKGGPEGGKFSINKTKLHHAEKMIRGAFMELYKGLGYLGTYRNLNMLAFVKILKKFDKAIKLMDEVEEIFIKSFAEDDKQKAMKYLKPHQRKESHAVTFFIGLFTGCFIALFTGYCIMAHLAGMYTGQSDSVYMETVYPVLSMFSLLFLHLFLYGCNIFMWRKMRINYSFIFEFAPTKELKYRDVFLICTTSMTIVVGVMFAHLSLTAKGYSSTKIQAIPGILLLVVMVDFFMADQLCSQCARRWFDEGQASHLVNLGKYVSAMLAAGAKVAYEKEKTIGWLSLVVVMFSTATVYQLYWDFVKDWGLLQPNSKNPWLRNELMLRRKFIYFLSMVRSYLPLHPFHKCDQY